MVIGAGKKGTRNDSMNTDLQMILVRFSRFTAHIMADIEASIGSTGDGAPSLSGRKCKRCGASNLVDGMNRLSCEFCRLPVCLKHRHHMDHSCTAAKEIIQEKRQEKYRQEMSNGGFSMARGATTHQLTFEETPAWHRMFIVAVGLLLGAGVIGAVVYICQS